MTVVALFLTVTLKKKILNDGTEEWYIVFPLYLKMMIVIKAMKRD